ncbi:MAG: hypothetical protein AAGI12_08015 [Pseudomonadota bacterium]
MTNPIPCDRYTHFMCKNYADTRILERMSMPELTAALTAIVASADALEGEINKPRCSGEAKTWLETILDQRLDDLAQTIVDVAVRKPRNTENDYRAFCELRLTWQLHCDASDPDEMLSVAQDLVRRAA